MPASPLAYAFGRHEKIKDGFIRMLGEISKRGQRLSSNSREPIGESIHEGRLLIKRARALLWFARPALGLAAHARARTRLRQAAGLLAEQRDLAVTQATLEQLARKTSKARDRAAVAQTFRSLVGDSAAGKATQKSLRQALRKAMGIFCQALAAVRRKAAGRAEWPSPSARLAKAFRTTRRKEKKARRTGKDTDYHEWRKKAKRLLYQLELTQAGMGRQRARAMKRVAKLQKKLGAYHDDVVVEDRLRGMPSLSPSARRVLRLLKKSKTRLRKKAKKIARSLESERWP